MFITPYLNFDGTCREAFEFYHRVLGGTLGHMQSFGESEFKDHMPPGAANRIVHARLDVGEQMLMGSDTPPNEPFSGPQGFAVSLTMDDPAEVDRIFNALAEGGTVSMPVQQTFWSKRFGMCTDRFGIAWIINCGQAA